jgi:hypothetical protein
MRSYDSYQGIRWAPKKDQDNYEAVSTVPKSFTNEWQLVMCDSIKVSDTDGTDRTCGSDMAEADVFID